MNPDEIRYFAGVYLEPRLPRLKRRDLAWAEPSDGAFICPIESIEMLLEFRRRRLASENLLELAAPLAALDSPTRQEPISGTLGWQRPMPCIPWSGT